MKPSILVVGIAVVDFVMTLETIPSAAKKYRAQDAAIVGGGGGANAAVAIARLGGKASLATRLGNDAIADLICDDLAREGVDCGKVRRFDGGRSSFSSIFIDRQGERQIVNYRDASLPDDPSWLELTCEKYDAVLADSRWPQGAAAAMAFAAAKGIPGVLDAEAPLDDCALALDQASHIVFSEQGLEAYAGNSDLMAGLAKADQQFGGLVGVTHGAAGVYWREGGVTCHRPAFPVEAVDTLGAGDIWHGAYALALSEAQGLKAAADFANAAAALKCIRPGGRSGAPDRAQVMHLLKGARLCS